MEQINKKITELQDYLLKVKSQKEYFKQAYSDHKLEEASVETSIKVLKELLKEINPESIIIAPDPKHEEK